MSLFRHFCQYGSIHGHGQPIRWASIYGEYPISPHGLKSAFPCGQEMAFMGARIANRAVVTIEVIGQVAIIVVMGMILVAIGASIYGMLGTMH